MLIKGKGCAWPTLGEGGSPKEHQSVPRVSAPDRWPWGCRWKLEKGQREEEKGDGLKVTKGTGRREEGRKRARDGARLPERAHVAVGAPPDSARGLFIEILVFCEMVKELKRGEIRNTRE